MTSHANQLVVICYLMRLSVAEVVISGYEPSEGWYERDRVEILGEKVSQNRFVHQKFHTD